MSTPATSTNSSMDPATPSSNAGAPNTSTPGSLGAGTIPSLMSSSTSAELYRLADADVQRVTQAVAQVISHSAQNPSPPCRRKQGTTKVSYLQGMGLGIGGTVKRVGYNYLVGPGNLPALVPASHIRAAPMGISPLQII